MQKGLEFLGEKFLSQKDQVGPEILANMKVIGLFFAGSWCPPCKIFTPILVDFYQEVNAMERNLEIVFISLDNSEYEYESYRAKMPWVAIPFNDTRIDRLVAKFNIDEIPCLLYTSPSPRDATLSRMPSSA
eukprot:TRINITY_DN19966_c0_g1_i1.p2 TRINITY_DN19966_c0_g1~~TRINITY_DN19966_c0_g1_i1.p2  ORF type:complete len:131 (-),score=34.15 TRINITY_DN19966_c0_g1_i1:9-401(-)